MATVPTEVTAVAGSVLTAAMWNSNVRDAANFLLSPPFFVGRQTAAQSFTSSTWAGVLLDTEDLDRDNGHSTVTNTTRYTAQTAGWYSCKAHMNFAGNSTGSRVIALQINSQTGLRYGKVALPAAAVNHNMTTACDLYFNVSDYVELIAWQSSGGSLNSIPTDEGTPGTNPGMSIRWVSQ